MHGLRDLGHWALNFLIRLGRSHLFLLRVLTAIPGVAARINALLVQIRELGLHSLGLIIVSGLLVGMVMSLQAYNALVDSGTEETLGVLVSLGLVRELGPVISALLFAGRAGTMLAAEIGLMKVSRKLDAVEMLTVDPNRRLVAQRFAAGIIAMPLLASIFTVAGIFGGFLVGVGLLGADEGAYWSQMQTRVEFVADVVNGVLIKSLVFGFLVTWIAVFEGCDASPTSEGVSAAATRTVVNASLAVLGADLILTALMFD